MAEGEENYTPLKIRVTDCNWKTESKKGHHTGFSPPISAKEKKQTLLAFAEAVRKSPSSLHYGIRSKGFFL